MKQIDNDIKNRKFKSAYIVFGEESYLVRQYAEKLRNAISGGGFALMNSVTFDGRGCEVQKIIDSAETVPFGSDYRLIEIKDSGLLTTGRKDDTDRLAKYLTNPAKTSVLLFTFEKIDKRNTLYKTVKKTGYCCEINKLKDKELTEKVISFSGNRLDRSIAEYFVKNTGDNLEVLTAEMDKLLNYVGNKSITKRDIDIACTKSVETKIFDMIGAIGRKDSDKALDIYGNLLLQKESPFGINKMIARQFRLILQCAYVYRQKKYSNMQIAAELGLREFIVRDCMEQSRNFSIPVLIQAVRDCAKTDADIKKGIIDAELGVELLILKYSAKGGN